MTFSSLLNHICYSGIKSTSTNSLGETTETWTYTTEDIKCRFVPITASQRVQLPGKFADVSYTVFMESSSKINMGDRLQFGDKYYRVRDSRLDSSYHHRTLMIEELP